MRSAGNILAFLSLGALVGGMLFFGAVMAPLVFTHLPLPVAGAFIRAAFPWYYTYIIASAGIGAAGLLLRRSVLAALVPLAIIGVTAWLWVYFLPLLDAWREAGNTAAFTRGHNLSVWINGGELFAALLLFIRLAARAG
jgi:hypothetical protein